MRLNLLLLLLFTLCVKQGMATSNADSLARVNLLKQLKLTPPTSSTAEKELIVFLGRSITNQGKVLHLQKAGDKWSGKLYTYWVKLNDSEKVKRFKKSKLTPYSDWEEVWQQLLAQHIQTLPSQSEIEFKLKKESGTTRNGQKGYLKVLVSDGSGYKVMMKQDNQVHYFSFHSPWAYLERFPDVEEINNYSNIINLLEQEFKIDFRK